MWSDDVICYLMCCFSSSTCGASRTLTTWRTRPSRPRLCAARELLSLHRCSGIRPPSLRRKTQCMCSNLIIAGQISYTLYMFWSWVFTAHVLYFVFNIDLSHPSASLGSAQPRTPQHRLKTPWRSTGLYSLWWASVCDFFSVSSLSINTAFKPFSALLS